MRYMLALAPLVLLAACTTPRQELQTELVGAGMSEDGASCMAKYMSKRLDLSQMRAIHSLGSLKDVTTRISLDRLLHKLRALGDPEILTVTTAAGAFCAIT